MKEIVHKFKSLPLKAKLVVGWFFLSALLARFTINDDIVILGSIAIAIPYLIICYGLIIRHFRAWQVSLIFQGIVILIQGFGLLTFLFAFSPKDPGAIPIVISTTAYFLIEVFVFNYLNSNESRKLFGAQLLSNKSLKAQDR